MARKNRQVESRMVADYLLKYYAAFPRLMMVPLGGVDDRLAQQVGIEKALNLSRPFRPEIDAIVVLPRHLLLIETKVFRIVDGLAKPPLYAALVPSTPELRKYLPREIMMQIVVAWSNANLEAMAAAAGVQVIVFTPAWLEAEVQRYHRYWTAEYQEARQKRLEMREYFGVE